MKKIIFLSISIFFCKTIVGQNSPLKKYNYINHTNNNDTINQYGFFRFGIDERTKDTIKHFTQIKKFQIITSDGVLISDGQVATLGCELYAHGYWIERYRNGNLKEQGTYYRNEKIGTWISFYKNGNLEKVETFKRPYSIDISEHRLPINFKVGDVMLSNKILRSDAYKEYYPNGLLKLEGQYSIIESYETVDTVIIFDPETYEEILILTDGEFWKPRSKKNGVWNYYNKNGKLKSSEKNNPYRNKNYRSIRMRYKELIKPDKKK